MAGQRKATRTCRDVDEPGERSTILPAEVDEGRSIWLTSGDDPVWNKSVWANTFNVLVVRTPR